MLVGEVSTPILTSAYQERQQKLAYETENEGFRGLEEGVIAVVREGFRDSFCVPDLPIRGFLKVSPALR